MAKIISFLASFVVGISAFAPKTAFAQDANLTYRVLSRAANATDAVQLRVLDASTGSPLESASVLIGEKAGSPFANNLGLTDASGTIEFRANELALNPTVTVTAHKEGFQALTVTALQSRDLDIFLMPAPRIDSMSFQRGSFTGWPTGLGRSRLEMGLFIPAFRASTMMNFDLGKIVSTYKEEMRIFGRTSRIPGNFVLTPQDKNYLFLPVHISKPEYAMPLEEFAQSHFVSVLGDAPLGDVVSEVRSDNYLGAMNLINFSRVNWTDWQVVRGENRLNIDANRRLQANQIVSISPEVPATRDLVALALVDPTGEGRALVPTDIKAVERTAKELGSHAEFDPYTVDTSLFPSFTAAAREIRLATLQTEPVNAKTYVFSAVMDQQQFAARPTNEMRFSLALTQVALENGRKVARAGKYYDLITLKSVSPDKRTFSFEFNAGNLPPPDYLVMNLVVLAESADGSRETRRVAWTSLLPATAREVKLPEITGIDPALLINPNPSGGGKERLQWEVLAVRRELANSPSVWDSMVTIDNLRQISHAIKAIP